MAARSTSYEVVEQTPELARPEVCRLWSQNLHLASSADQHFQWLFHDALEPSRAFLLRARSPEGDTQIVGANSVSVRRYQLGHGLDGRAAINGDFVVELSHRGLLPALQLARAVRACIVTDFDVGYGFPNAKAEGVLVHAGFTLLGTTARHVRVLRHAPYLPEIAARLKAPAWLARLARRPHVAGVLGPLFDVARLARTAPQIARVRSHHRLEWCDGPDARFDDLWSRARGEYEVIGARTSAFLRWRYPRCEIAAMIRDQALVAYAIVDRDPETGAAHLRDVFGYKREIGPLLDLLIPSLHWHGATSISVRFLGAPYVLAELATHGFEPRPEHRTIVVQVGAAREELRSRVEDAAAWHLFDVDEDT